MIYAAPVIGEEGRVQLRCGPFRPPVGYASVSWALLIGAGLPAASTPCPVTQIAIPPGTTRGEGLVAVGPAGAQEGFTLIAFPHSHPGQGRDESRVNIRANVSHAHAYARSTPPNANHTGELASPAGGSVARK
jgi:hypothetical protein